MYEDCNARAKIPALADALALVNADCIAHAISKRQWQRHRLAQILSSPFIGIFEP